MSSKTAGMNATPNTTTVTSFTLVNPTSALTTLRSTTSGPVDYLDEDIFFQTAAARGVSGVFVWLALIISCHQVRN